MRIRLLRRLAVIAAAMTPFISLGSLPASAATWGVKYDQVGTCAGITPIAGNVYFRHWSSYWGMCFANGTSVSTVDADLTNDTWSIGDPMAPGIDQVGHSLGTGNYVSIWRGKNCSGVQQTVTLQFAPSVDYYSFRRNSTTSPC